MMKSHVWYCSKIMKGKDVQLMARNAKANLGNKKDNRRQTVIGA